LGTRRFGAFSGILGELRLWLRCLTLRFWRVDLPTIFLVEEEVMIGVSNLKIISKQSEQR
jgi:hypothetical protein